MSDPNLPPPPGFAPAPPAPPPPPSLPSAPPGYVTYDQPRTGSLPQPIGLRKATIVLFAVVSALSAILGLVAYQRGDTADDFLHQSATRTALKDADGRVAAVAGLLILVELAAVIVLAVWSARTVGNAKRRDPRCTVSPGLAAGGWFIPIGNYFVPWQQLRRAAANFGVVSRSLNMWQGLFIVSAAVSVVARIVGNVTTDNVANSASKLHAQGLFFFLTAALFVGATRYAATAMAQIDAATAGA